MIIELASLLKEERSRHADETKKFVAITNAEVRKLTAEVQKLTVENQKLNVALTDEKHR